MVKPKITDFYREGDSFVVHTTLQRKGVKFAFCSKCGLFKEIIMWADKENYCEKCTDNYFKNFEKIASEGEKKE